MAIRVSKTTATRDVRMSLSGCFIITSRILLIANHVRVGIAFHQFHYYHLFPKFCMVQTEVTVFFRKR
jgi:hypothetical protein